MDHLNSSFKAPVVDLSPLIIKRTIDKGGLLLLSKRSYLSEKLGLVVRQIDYRSPLSLYDDHIRFANKNHCCILFNHQYLCHTLVIDHAGGQPILSLLRPGSDIIQRPADNADFRISVGTVRNFLTVIRVLFE